MNALTKLQPSMRGCSYASRCPYVIKGTCETKPPPVREFGRRHLIVCHLPPEQLMRIATSAKSVVAPVQVKPAVMAVAAEPSGSAAAGSSQAAAPASVPPEAPPQPRAPAAAPDSAARDTDWARRALAILSGGDGTLAEKARKALQR